jgi:endonuclease G
MFPFFEVEVVAGNAKLGKPIDLAKQLRQTENVATIGYPAYDSRIPEPDLMERIYGKTYNKKRLAPGAVTRVDRTSILHNCTTLGGNSGSVVLDLDSGKALGLHFSGTFMTANYAVRADVVRKLLTDVRSGGARSAGSTSNSPSIAKVSEGQPRKSGYGTTSLTIPLTVTVSLGDMRLPRNYRSPSAVQTGGGDVVEGEEAVVADYRDREGYHSEFLGNGFAVALPSVDRAAADVLEFEVEGESGIELRYEHYSVVMCRSRRMCFFSAVNIDGNLSKKSKRVGWKWDPRVPKSQQIMNECYGSPPKFSRGHMTRREDPGWGDAKVAKRGNEDSMHVTNATPQMQAFNAPIWLALEDYALQHAREDDMKISVFTGPYFDDEHDPEMFGVRIPIAFWKIIAFIHDDTGKRATGYEMNQEQSLRRRRSSVRRLHLTAAQRRDTSADPVDRIAQRHQLWQTCQRRSAGGENEGLADGGLAYEARRMEEIRFVR